MTHNQLPITSYRIPRYAIYALLIFTPLARASVQGWAIAAMQAVTLVALTAFLAEKSLTGNWRWIRTPLDKPIIVLILVSILSTVFSVHKYTSIWSVILLINYLIIYYLTIHTVRTRSHLRQLTYIIIWIGAFLAIIGLIKLGGSNPFTWWDYADLDYGQRLTGTYGNPNHLAGYLEMAIPLLLGLFLIGYGRINLFFMICLFILLFSAIILSLSRGGWLGLAGGLAFMGFALLTQGRFKRKKLVVSLICGFLIVGLIVLSSTPVVKRIRTLDRGEKIGTLHTRISVWSGILKMIQDYPVLGTGPGTFATVFTQYQPPGQKLRYFNAHSDYLQLTAEAGLSLAVIMGWMIWVFYNRGFKKLNNPSRLVRGVTLGSMSGITAILIHSVSDFNLHIPANAVLFTVLSAIVVAPLPQYKEFE